MSSISQAPYCILNGRLVPAAEAVISVQDRGFRYGDGVFETIAVAGGVPYQFAWHMARLASGLQAVKIAFDVNSLRPYAQQLLKKNALDGGILRIQVTRGIGSNGYMPMNTQAHFVIETAPKPALPPEPVSLWHSSYMKISAQALPIQYKLCQGLNSTLARMEAVENHCFDALLLNAQRQLCETSSGNIFWLQNGALYTPALNCGVLEGSTRAALLRLLPVIETEAKPETLAQAEAVCITNAAWGALAVNIFMPKNITWRSEKLAAQLNETLAEDRKKDGAAHSAEWE